MLRDFFKCQHWQKLHNRVQSYPEVKLYKPTQSLDKVDTIKSTHPLQPTVGDPASAGGLD